MNDKDNALLERKLLEYFAVSYSRDTKNYSNEENLFTLFNTFLSNFANERCILRIDPKYLS